MVATGSAFLTEFAPKAQAWCKKYGLRASVCIAQAIIESDWGRKAIGGYNVFGRKWAPGKGAYVEKVTTEYKGGKPVVVKDKFRVYNSYDEALYSYCELMTHAPYQNVKPKYSNLDAYVQEVARVYCTDPNYAKKVINVIKMNNLARFDA